MAINARLGDTVKKGQLLLTIRSDDVAGGFDAYRKAVADDGLRGGWLRGCESITERKS